MLDALWTLVGESLVSKQLKAVNQKLFGTFHLRGLPELPSQSHALQRWPGHYWTYLRRYIDFITIAWVSAASAWSTSIHILFRPHHPHNEGRVTTVLHGLKMSQAALQDISSVASQDPGDIKLHTMFVWELGSRSVPASVSHGVSEWQAHGGRTLACKIWFKKLFHSHDRHMEEALWMHDTVLAYQILVSDREKLWHVLPLF